MKQLFSSPLGRDFWLFRLGQLTAVVGDSCGHIALAWWVLEKTGSAAAMSSVIAPAMVARIFLLPLFGPVADRLPRKGLIAFSDAWRAVLTFAVAAMAMLDIFQLPVIVFLFVLSGAGSALFTSAAGSIVPQLVAREYLQRAMQQSHAVQSVGTILGGITGGIVVTTIGVGGAFLVNGFTFTVALFATLLIRANTKPRENSVKESPVEAIRSWHREFVGGFRTMFRIPVLFWLSCTAMLMNFMLAPLAVILPILVKEGRELPPWFLGALESSIGIGAVAGAFAVGFVLRRLRPDYLLMLAIAGMGAGVAALQWIPNLFLPLGIALGIGLMGVFANVPLSTQMSLSVPDHYRARIMSIMGFMCQGVAPLGVALSGFLISWLGLETSMIVMGVSLMAVTPLLAFVPLFREFMRADPASASTFFRRHYPNALTEAESSTVA